MLEHTDWRLGVFDLARLEQRKLFLERGLAGNEYATSQDSRLDILGRDNC